MSEPQRLADIEPHKPVDVSAELAAAAAAGGEGGRLFRPSPPVVADEARPVSGGVADDG